MPVFGKTLVVPHIYSEIGRWISGQPCVNGNEKSRLKESSAVALAAAVILIRQIARFIRKMKGEGNTSKECSTEITE